MNKWIAVGVLLVVVLVAVFMVQLTSIDEHVEGVKTGRWYSETEVAQGASLYQTNCASCHGPEAAATPDWRVANEQGHYPPPPLNGTAHAWHHPINLLRKTVQDGGIPLGGQMPPFKEILSEAEIDAVLAWVQSHWSDEIYQRWSGRNGQ